MVLFFVILRPFRAGDPAPSRGLQSSPKSRYTGFSCESRIGFPPRFLAVLGLAASFD
jgi:hypothetical protein